jgi:hypothetical protein
VVSSLTPCSGTAFAVVFIRGKNFTGATTVDFGSKRAFHLSLGTSLIVALVPAGNSGTVDVTVKTRNGTSATSSADQYTYR